MRKAEVIYVGDAQSIVRASREAEAAVASASSGISKSSKASGDAAVAAAAKHESAGKRIASSFKNTVSSVVPLPLALGGAALAAVKFATDFQAKMEMVHTQAGASTAEVTKMSKAVLNLGLTTEQGPRKLADALYVLESVGLRGGTALAALTAASHGAAVGQADLTDTTHALAGVMVALHEKGGQAAAQMGAIDAVVGVGKMHMQDFVDSLKSGIVPTAHAVGLSFQSMAAGLATLTDAGVPAEMAATKMRTILLMLAHEHTKAAVDGLAEVGLTADNLAQAMRAPGNGLLNVLTLLHDHMDSLSKVKQVDLLSSLAGGSRSAGTLITLIQNMDRVGNKYTQIGNLTTQFNQRVAAESQTTSHKVNVAWSAIQTAMIEAGQKMLPVLGTILGAVDKFIIGVQKGTGIGGAFRTVFVTAFNAVKAVIVPLGSALGTVVDAFGGLKAILPAIVGGFVVFKGVSVILAVAGTAVTAFTGALDALAASFAATVDAEAAAKAETVGMANPVGVVAAGIGLLAGAVLLLRGHEISEADAAKAVTDAKNKEADAIRQAQDAALGAADASFNAMHASDALTSATNATAAAAKKYGTNSPQYRSALQAEHEASLQNVEAQHQLAKANQDTAKADQQAIQAARARMAADKDAANAIAKKAFQDGDSAAQIRAKVLPTIRDYVAAEAKLSGAKATAQLQEFQLQRLMQGGDLITAKNAQSVSNLATIYRSLPKSVQTKLLADKQDALAKIGDVVGKLHGVVSLRTIAKILGDSTNAQQAITALTNLLAGIPSKAHDAGLSFSAQLAAGIRDGMGAVVSAVSSSINTVTSMLNITIPGPKIGPPHKAGDVASARSNPYAGLLFPVDAQITSLQNLSAADQARFAALASSDQRRQLVGSLIGAKHEKPGAQRNKDIANAISALKAFDLAASQAKTLAQIDLKVKGLQQLKDFSDAIASIKSQTQSLAQQAAQSWRTSMENAINATHDAAIKSAQSIHDATMASIASGPEATQLAALQAQDAAEQAQQQRDQLNQNLTDAQQAVTDAQTLVDHSGGQAHVDAIAALATAVQKVKDAQTAITDYERQQTEAQLQATITAQQAAADSALSTATQSADDTQATALASLDQQQTDYQTFLDTKLTALDANLAAQTITYKQWAQQVDAILGQYGLAVTTDSGTEATITAGPGAAKPTVKPGKPKPKKPKPKKHKAMGGPVYAGEAYTVGEQGEETFVPDRNGVILTHSQTQQSKSGGNVHIEKAYFQGTQAARALADRWAFRAHIGVA